MTRKTDLNCGELGVNRGNTVRTELDLTNRKKPWEKGFCHEEHAQKAELQRALGDSGRGISNRED